MDDYEPSVAELTRELVAIPSHDDETAAGDAIERWLREETTAHVTRDAVGNVLARKRADGSPRDEPALETNRTTVDRSRSSATTTSCRRPTHRFETPRSQASTSSRSAMGGSTGAARRI